MKSMKVTIPERRRKIEAFLDQGLADIDRLSRELHVSSMTIRRDLAVLEKQGKVLRTFGGAIPSGRLAYEFTFKEKEARNKKEKEWIGRISRSLVHPQDVVFIDTGSTALAVAKALRSIKPLTLVTINLCVASEYVGQNETRVLVPGGELSAHSPDLYGEWTLEFLSRIHVDVAFLGCDGIDPAEGFYASDIKVAAVSRLILSRSRMTYLAADSSKFDKKSFCCIAPLSHLKGIITDEGLSRKTCQTLLEKQIPLYQKYPDYGKEPHARNNPG